jgi:hypothetical protein
MIERAAMGNISTHLSRFEFACNCGCGFRAADSELIKILEDTAIDIQTECQAGRVWIIIHSGCRCAKYNKSIGGAPKSEHINGIAADVSFAVRNGHGPKSYDPAKVYAKWHKLFSDRYGLGNGKTFTHIDMRKQKARWTYGKAGDAELTK